MAGRARREAGAARRRVRRRAQHGAGPRGGFGARHRPGGAAAALPHRRGPARNAAHADGKRRAGRMTRPPFGAGWRFGPASAGSDRPEFDDSGFAVATLPHTVTPLSWQDWDPAAWERGWAYRKHFDAPPGPDRTPAFPSLPPPQA